jgi:tRNA(Ile)-lysidine synthase
MTDSVTKNSDLAAASSGTPLDAVVFEQLIAHFAPFEDKPRLAVAVSGGADSMALVLLADQWCQARGGAVLAITVDHGLRADSAAEADWVGSQLARYGIEHVIARWEGVKPSGAVQERARIARYDLINDIMARHGIFHLLVAHHAGDQAETMAMRQLHNAGTLGRAGMSAQRFLCSGRLLRPLLNVPKADLIATLRDFGQDWLEDPSNHNDKFERVRVRKSLQDQNVQADALRNADADRVSLEHHIGGLLARAVTLHSCGVALFDYDMFFATDLGKTTRVYGLGQVVRTVGGADYMPAFDALDAAICKLSGDATARISLGGCMLHGRKGHICIYREVGRVDPIPLVVSANFGRAHTVMRWDNRFELLLNGQTDASLEGLLAGPLDLCDVSHTKTFRAALCEIVPFIGNLPRAALASMPALYDKEGLRSVGGLEVSELSDVLSAAGCDWPLGRGKFALGGGWRFAPPVPLWESGFKSSPKPDNLLA